MLTQISAAFMEAETGTVQDRPKEIVDKTVKVLMNMAKMTKKTTLYVVMRTIKMN